MSLRSVLRAQARELAQDRCDWPDCQNAGAELAHIHSIGAGGRRSADTIENVAWMCHQHARMTDGIQSDWPSFKQSHTALFGDGWEWRIPMDRWGWERAEALTALIAKRRAR